MLDMRAHMRGQFRLFAIVIVCPPAVFAVAHALRTLPGQIPPAGGETRRLTAPRSNPQQPFE